MNHFKVTEDRRVFLNETEIKQVFGFSVNAEAGSGPEVVLRVAVDRIDIEGYTDRFTQEEEKSNGN